MSKTSRFFEKVVHMFDPNKGDINTLEKRILEGFDAVEKRIAALERANEAIKAEELVLAELDYRRALAKQEAKAEG